LSWSGAGAGDASMGQVRRAEKQSRRVENGIVSPTGGLGRQGERWGTAAGSRVRGGELGHARVNRPRAGWRVGLTLVVGQADWLSRPAG